MEHLSGMQNGREIREQFIELSMPLESKRKCSMFRSEIDVYRNAALHQLRNYLFI